MRRARGSVADEVARAGVTQVDLSVNGTTSSLAVLAVRPELVRVLALRRQFRSGFCPIGEGVVTEPGISPPTEHR